MKNLTETKKLISTARQLNGTTFANIGDYVTEKGVKNAYLIVVGYKLRNLLKKDFLILQQNKAKIEAFEGLDKEGKPYNPELIKQVYFELYTSLEKRLSDEITKEKLRLEGDSTIKRSDAQIDAYINLAPGIDWCIETKNVRVIGIEVRKTFIENVEMIKNGEVVTKKTVNSSDKTILKSKISNLCNFRQSKIRSFIFEKAEVSLLGLKFNELCK